METVIVAALSLAGTLAGAYLANRRSSALIAYRLEQLEQKVNKHNNLEEAAALADERIRVANRRIADLERRT